MRQTIEAGCVKATRSSSNEKNWMAGQTGFGREDCVDAAADVVDVAVASRSLVQSHHWFEVENAHFD